MKLYSNKDEYKDYCDSNAFVELNFKIDMLGSKISIQKDPDNSSSDIEIAS